MTNTFACLLAGIVIGAGLTILMPKIQPANNYEICDRFTALPDYMTCVTVVQIMEGK